MAKTVQAAVWSKTPEGLAKQDSSRCFLFFLSFFYYYFSLYCASRVLHPVPAVHADRPKRAWDYTIVHCLSQARRNIPQKTTSPTASGQCVNVLFFLTILSTFCFGHFVPVFRLRMCAACSVCCFLIQCV